MSYKDDFRSCDACDKTTFDRELWTVYTEASLNGVFYFCMSCKAAWDDHCDEQLNRWIGIRKMWKNSIQKTDLDN
jgi:hypothetical protein